MGEKDSHYVKESVQFFEKKRVKSLNVTTHCNFLQLHTHVCLLWKERVETSECYPRSHNTGWWDTFTIKQMYWSFINIFILFSPEQDGRQYDSRWKAPAYHEKPAGMLIMLRIFVNVDTHDRS